jgi:5-methylcytosine-specific restriction protein A
MGFITCTINRVRCATRDLLTNAKRSSHWPTVEHAYRKLHPVCEACGSDVRLNVHHKRPFHLHPELELDPSNLITLCMGPNECHLLIGHGDNFRAYNPNVDADVEKVRSHPSLREEIIVEAKQNRLFE